MSVYRDYSEIELEQHLSNYLVNSWSYSKVAQFARHEKAFEMIYIYRERGKTSASTIAGQAYHFALRTFFYAFRNGERFDIVDLEKFAFDFIDERPAFIWKLQKTTPTVEEAIKEAYKVVTALLRNFFGELSTYIDEIAEILFIEERYEEFVTLNGVDIPLPCNGEIDLVIRTKSGKIVIVDHKSKRAFTDEVEMKLVIGTQAITYVKLVETRQAITVDEVWFVENKFSQNKDKSIKQLSKFIVKMDSDTRRLYEFMLYEKLKRMIEAVSDPDYTYLINDSDSFVSMADIYTFTCKTMIAEIEEFNIDPSKRALIAKRMKKIRDVSIATINPVIIKNFQKNAAEFIQYDLSNKNMTPQQKIEHSLRTFGIVVNVPYSFDGYSSDTYLIDVSAGTKISSIQSHRLDLANALDVSNVRMSKELVMHEKKSYLSLDFSKPREKDLIFETSDLSGCKLPIGKDNLGNIIHWDLNNESTPHLLMCGATGSGKSVSIIVLIEYAILAGIHDIVILDPKNEFDNYKSDGRVRVVSDIMEIEQEMAIQVEIMNEMVANKKRNIRLLIFDEFADAIDTSRKGAQLDVKEMVQVGFYAPKKMMGIPMPPEPKMQLQVVKTLKSLDENLKMLAQKSRSTGLRILTATQRASTKIISGDIKANFPVVVCYYMKKPVDSMVVLGEQGAEDLSGKGDGLIKSPEYRETIRFQSYYKPHD